MINNYLDLIYKQRIKHPLYQKDYRLIYLPQKIKEFNLQDELNILISFPNIKFCNVVYRPTPLYKNLKDNYYYEFIETGAGSTTTLEDWRFFYFPLSFSQALINEELLPYYFYYDVTTQQIRKEYPTFQSLIPFTKSSDYFYNIANENNKHPLSPIFTFTGFTFLNKEGNMLYEYKDTSSYNDHNEVEFYSLIRPLNFFNSSSITTKYSLELDIELLFLEGAPPSFLEIYNKSSLEDLRFTGKTTTPNFNNFKKWYEYSNYINGQSFNKILLPYVPTNLSLDFVKIQLNNTNVGFIYNTTFNQQSLKIKQNSLNNIIKLS